MFEKSPTQLSILTPEKAPKIILRDYQEKVKTEIRDRNLKPNTINRKVAAVKSLVAYARRTG